MRVLIACEFSGVIRRAFRALGHDAWSCDLLPSEDNSPYHIVGDAIRACHKMMPDLLIAHPPCTYLCNSGVRWLSPGGKLNADRHAKMKEACDFFAGLYWNYAGAFAIENPVMHKYAKDYLQSVWKIPSFSQSIQPWQFGHGEVKRTCLWLRNLPLLKPTDIVSGRTPRVHFASPGKDRWKERMAEQWSNL